MLAFPEEVEYDSKEFSIFMEKLREQDFHTVRFTINEPDALLLDQRGRLLQSGFQLSPLAFKQICGYVSRGL